MPPAFNLSQDQTLQFDLENLLNGIEVNFTSFYRERLQARKPASLATRWHSPSNAHTYRLLVFKERRLAALLTALGMFS